MMCMWDYYDVQAEALTQPGVLSGRNLVFTAPTSAGKSAVAEILMLRRLCEFKDKVSSPLPISAVIGMKQSCHASTMHTLQGSLNEVTAARVCYAGLYAGAPFCVSVSREGEAHEEAAETPSQVISMYCYSRL